MRCARPHMVCSNRVDLPAPGLPPMRMAEPGTTPPPSTRSSSLKPELKRGISVVAISARVCTWLPTAPA